MVAFDERIKTLAAELGAAAKAHDGVKRLLSIPGIGALKGDSRAIVSPAERATAFLHGLQPAWAYAVRLQPVRIRSDLGIMRRLVWIGEAAEVLGVSISTLRRWEASGRLVADRVGTPRPDDLASPRSEHFQASRTVERRTVADARVSSHDQKADLELQKQVLELHCAKRGWTCEMVADLGSGMNTDKRGLKRLLDGIVAGEVGRLVVTHEDRLLRFGAELVFAICAARRVEVVIVIRGEDTTLEDDLAEDVLEIGTAFSARLYGSRSRKNQKLQGDVRRATEAAGAC